MVETVDMDCAGDRYESNPCGEVESPQETNKNDLGSRRAYRRGLALLLLVVIGHLCIPWTLQSFFGYGTRFGVIRFVSLRVSVFEVLGAFFVGLWIAQYFAIWLWLHASTPSRVSRWMIGLFLALLISYTALFGMSISWGPPPIEVFLLFFLGGAGVYSLLGLILSVLLRSSQFVWKPRASTAGSRYSLKTLLGAMVGSALLMLAIKSFPFHRATPSGSIVQKVVIISIWMVWLAVAISILAWLQLGTVFGLRRRRFGVCFLIVMLLGPALFHAIGLWLLSWATSMSGEYSFDELVIAYAIEMGLVAGTGIVIRWLPRNSSAPIEDAASGLGVGEDV
ncbi:MAG: hypothetical protein FJ308_14340 [Planctomycetes bacterium]|nr:hypothetical protein [Planctomycetota bacterium]